MASDETQIKGTLNLWVSDHKRWAHEGRKLIFWYDPEESFREIFDDIEVDGLEKYELADSPFYEKYYLLVEHPQKNFLVYAPFAEPAPKENWMLDLQLSGQVFSADPAAMIYRTLGLHTKRLEHAIRQQQSFFNSKKRYDDLVAMNLATDIDEAGLQLGMMSVLAKLKVPDASLLIRRVLIAGIAEDKNKLWQEIDKFVGAKNFWQMVKTHLHYKSEKPSLLHLLMSVAVTHMKHRLQTDLPESIRQLKIEPEINAYAFVDNWQRDKEEAELWKKATKEIAGDLKIQELAQSLEPESYAEVETFLDFDHAMLRSLVDRLDSEAVDYASLRRYISKRKGLFWFEDFRDYYGALESAADFYELLGKYSSDFASSVKELFNDYTQEIHKIDQFYRHYIAASDRVPSDILKDLNVSVESAYVNNYLDRLHTAWSKALEKEQKTSTVWGEGFRSTESDETSIELQWEFFIRHVNPPLTNNNREKYFVIISDSLRYEVAEELEKQLLLKLRGESKLEAMLGVLPSRTNFGMAALLPGKTISVSDNQNYIVRKDGHSTQGRPEREKLLQKTQFEAIALDCIDILNPPSREHTREKIKPYRLIYIYHDVIDDIGESAAHKTFEACETALAELEVMVSRIVNSYNGTHVYVTSDHGFLYQRQNLEAADKLNAHTKDDLFELKRRHALGTEAHKPVPSLAFDLPYLENELQAFVPKGNQRFSIQGAGGQYVHGGVSLQEITIPRLYYKHVRAQKGDDGPSQKVTVQVITSKRRVTNKLFNLRLLQQEAVGGRLKPLQITVGFYDEAGNAISDEKTIALDKTSQQATEREQTIRMTISKTNLDRRASYYLIINDADDTRQLLKEQWTINLAFNDEF